MIGFYPTEPPDIYEDPAHFLTRLVENLVFGFIRPEATISGNCETWRKTAASK
jgi:hypothetical protein